jgi:hypothetical protein
MGSGALPVAPPDREIVSTEGIRRVMEKVLAASPAVTYIEDPFAWVSGAGLLRGLCVAGDGVESWVEVVASGLGSALPSRTRSHPVREGCRHLSLPPAPSNLLQLVR